MKYLLAFMLSGFFMSSAFCQSPKAKALVAKMTTEEKVNLVVGMGMNIPGLTKPQGQGGTGVGQTMDKVAGAAGTTFAIPRLGIPTTVVADGPAGLRIDPTRKDQPGTFYATAWPVGTLLASTWDTKLLETVGKAMGNEVKEYGVDVILGPALNIHRNPLGGRNFEYFSEDPLVSGKMTAALVNGIESNGVGTSIKHFAVNNQEKNRNTLDVTLSERALREIYLKGFQIAVKESQPWTIMSSYNKINGTYASESAELLTTILRKEWGFKGIVMTDWFGGADAAAQMRAGNDLLMPGTPEQNKAITQALQNGKLDMKALDENVGRLIDYVFATGSFRKSKFSNKPDLKAHAQLARKAASEGMILLKNENQALPISKNIKTIAAFGNTSYDFISGGTGSGDVNEEYTVSLVDGLTNAGFKLDPELKLKYNGYIADENAKHPKKSFFEEFLNPTPRMEEYVVDQELINKKAAEADIALVTIGRNAGEGRDRTVENDFNLKERERTILTQIAQAFHAKNKKVIVVVNAGGVIEVASWQGLADAVLLSWQPGLEAGNAVSDVLSGKVNPSGRLTSTFPVRYEDDPSSKNFPGIEFPEKAVNGLFGMKMIPAEVTYEEGIYVGYRYFNSFGVKPAYPFGYGLSYTTFDISDLKLSSATLKEKITVTVTVKNTGKVAGRQVVQLYVSAPAGKLEKPAIELKGFAKTSLLAPGQQEVVSIPLQVADLASFHTDRSAWIAEAGTYTVKVGASSVDIKQEGTFSLSNEVVTEKVNKVLMSKSAIREIKR